MATLPAEPGETPSSPALQHPHAGSQGSAPLSSLLAPGSCMVAHRAFSSEGTENNNSPSQQELLRQEKHAEKFNYWTAQLRELLSFSSGSPVGKTSSDFSTLGCPQPPGSCFTLTLSGPTPRAEQALKHQSTWPFPAQEDGSCLSMRIFITFSS